MSAAGGGRTLLRSVRPLAADRTGIGEPVDVLVSGHRVAAIGPGLDPGGAEVVDGDGRALLPGLWDHHVHMAQWALARRRLDVSGARSAAECAALVAERLAQAPPAPGEALVGFGFRDSLWPDEAHRDLLDPLAGDVPVVLVSGDLHQGWLNGPALDRFGHRGHPTGRIRESEFFAVTVALQDVPDETLDGFVADAAAAASARGVVGIVDFEAPWSLPDWRRRIAAGATGLRVEASVWPDRLDDLVATGLRTGDAVDGCDGLLTAGPLKVITDGSLNTRTAYCYDPYPAPPGALIDNPCGLLLVPPDELRPLLARAHDAGLEAALHAIGDHANTLVLDAFAATGARGRIEHAQLLTGDDVPRFAALGLVASVQPEHALDDRDVADRLWAGRTGRAFAFASLHGTGARLALGSDAPVAPLDPWVALAAAVHRSADGRERWHPEQELDRAVALGASFGVVGGSTARVAEGVRADLVLTDADPVTCDPAVLRAMPVAGTLVGGRWTHRDGV
ncbi:amidohydrolase [Pseudonocardia sp. EC080610-09]|uniref:amidohydrolase n=1 Tax=unclassified Pseudonocardia TaxID=2619320 RepID=UPI0006CB75A4|nr:MULTISPECIES: amidohydrolase family protein [unclassified Pseudonocardia]ALE73617.1 amidohydrolase [Pseudonocardia sp. EC080625-04]ALL76850.1 amidohydrolase [Pseudonocardia sp. EC080610-09]ALL83881.1 amidohydrolase [Pseudonocardia sp. EC080619-01]